MRVFDCFPYFNEVELLELRLKLLWDHVSGFIITEGDHTFSGDAKPFTCVDQLKILGVPMHKVRVIHVNLPDLATCDNHWWRERTQRDAAAHLFEPDAAYIVSDCDEIINPHMIPELVQGCLQHPDHIIRLNLAWLCGKVNLRVCHPPHHPARWQHAFMCQQHHTQLYGLSQIREDQACELHQLHYPSISLYDQDQKLIDCGWHMSFLGGNERIKFKMQNYSHCDDAQAHIFENAVGAIRSDRMQSYLNTYEPQAGGRDPYGRSDYVLTPYAEHLLPDIMHHLTHLKTYLFGSES